MKLKVGVQIYTVKEVPEKELQGDKGECDTSDNTIRLHMSMPKSQYRHTLLHETLHAINVELDETTVEFFTGAIEQVLTENKQLTKLFL